MGLREGQPGTAALLFCKEEAEEQELHLLLVFGDWRKDGGHYGCVVLRPEM